MEEKKPRRRREHSVADQSQSDMTSDVQSRRSKRFKLKKGLRGLESTSKMDSSSNASGFMSRATKNKGIRRRGDGKGSAALARAQVELKLTQDISCAHSAGVQTLRPERADEARL